MTTKEILEQARDAKVYINSADTAVKNKALACMADKLTESADKILAANQEDMEQAKGKISDVMLDRLLLTEDRIAGMAQGIRELIDLPDPAGKVLRSIERPNGMIIEKTAIPLGVIAIIYESRPNVTSDAAALCIKRRQTPVCFEAARRRGRAPEPWWTPCRKDWPRPVCRRPAFLS